MFSYEETTEYKEEPDTIKVTIEDYLGSTTVTLNNAGAGIDEYVETIVRALKGNSFNDETTGRGLANHLNEYYGYTVFKAEETFTEDKEKQY